MASNYPQPALHHKRAKSAVLSFIKRAPSAGDALTDPPQHLTHDRNALPLLPHDHPHSRALGELQHNQQNYNVPAPQRKSGDDKRSNADGSRMHKKTLSTISLKSLSGRDTEKAHKVKDAKPEKPKKVKSSTNLASLLSRPKSSKSLRKQAREEEERAEKNKENQVPASSPSEDVVPPPIYAQFSTEYFAKQQYGGKFLEEEIDLYTPQNYSPGKQRNFYQGSGQYPSLGQPEANLQRPRLTYLPSNYSLQDLTRKVSSGSRHSTELVRKLSDTRRPSSERSTTASSTGSDKVVPSRGSRMMNAVSSLTLKQKSLEKPCESSATQTHDTSTRSKEAPQKEARKHTRQDPKIADQDVDKEFEAMLDRRNIPEHQRGKMRSLAMSMKRDFIRQDWAESVAAQKGTLGEESVESSAEMTAALQETSEAKSKRPRSRTFTLSRSASREPASPVKKSKGGPTFGRNSRTNSTESVKDTGKSLTSSSAAAAQTLIAKAKGQTPHDFVSYLKKVQKPEAVEVGKLHKLRLLLRNETVAWTDDFIGQGGMQEIVELLHRILGVEWREEHEDALLHEVLLCLKALSTTALALKHLNDIQPTLFPALVHMIFDEEKKGPSEFTTRHLVTWLLFTYLKMAPLQERPHRAKTLLSYLKDPEPSESKRPVEFVLDMRKERPYRVWCKEVSNVTKEVFWIFLHNLNVVSLPGSVRNENGEVVDNGSATINTAISTPGFDITNYHHVYMVKNFPKELPPVAAAPYVGGVEWEATNYLASHLDLINGILACLESKEERNMLRQHLLLSGWEKVMGSTLRLCKEKFYGGVHAGLRCWVAAAHEDDWDTHDVRCGPSTEARSPVRKSPKKANVEEAPKIDMKLDFLGATDPKPKDDDVWL